MASGVVWIETVRNLMIGWRRGGPAIVSGAAKVKIRVVEQRHDHVQFV